jgi:ribosomal protein S18 acetylase RimI-like enzyme
MIARVGDTDWPEIGAYLRAHYRENVYLLSDLQQRRLRSMQGAALPGGDNLDLIGYRENGTLLAAQGFYRLGRWFPYFHDPRAIEPMLRDALRRRIRWVMGPRRVVDPLIEGITAEGLVPDFDEYDEVWIADAAQLRPHAAEGVRRAAPEDAPGVAVLRRAFEHEYFGVPVSQVDQDWCLRAARSYITDGAYVTERAGEIVSMAAVEAAIPEMTQIGAVYTLPEWRDQGLGRAAVSALAQESLGHTPEVGLVVAVENAPARRAYTALGFQRNHDYRMTHLS